MSKFCVVAVTLSSCPHRKRGRVEDGMGGESMDVAG